MRRNEIPPPGFLFFGEDRQLLFNQRGLRQPTYYHILNQNRQTVRPCPERQITQRLGPYPINELQNARDDLINCLYFTPSIRGTAFHQVRELVGIVSNQFGAFPPVTTGCNRMTYEEHSTSELQTLLPCPLPPSDFYKNYELNVKKRDSFTGRKMSKLNAEVGECSVNTDNDDSLTHSNKNNKTNIDNTRNDNISLLNAAKNYHCSFP